MTVKNKQKLWWNLSIIYSAERISTLISICFQHILLWYRRFMPRTVYVSYQNGPVCMLSTVHATYSICNLPKTNLFVFYQRFMPRTVYVTYQNGPVCILSTVHATYSIRYLPNTDILVCYQRFMPRTVYVTYQKLTCYYFTNGSRHVHYTKPTRN